MADVLEVRGLRLGARRGGRPVELVRGIDLSVRAGRVTALVAPAAPASR